VAPIAKPVDNLICRKQLVDALDSESKYANSSGRAIDKPTIRCDKEMAIELWENLTSDVGPLRYRVHDEGIA
jgi:hypothetical protein